MRIKNNLMSIIFQDFDSRYFIEVIMIIGICITVYLNYVQSLSLSPHLNFSYPEMSIPFYFKQYLYYTSYPLFTIFSIVIIVISAYEVFLFSSSIVKNKFLVMYSMGFGKNSIIISYFILFIFYPLIILCIAYSVISYVDFLSLQYYIIWHLILFTFIDLMFFISIGMILSVITKNSLIPGPFIIIFFYFLVPLVYIRPHNTILSHLVDPVYSYLDYGFNHIAFIAAIIEILLSLIFIFLTMLIARYRDMKVVR